MSETPLLTPFNVEQQLLAVSLMGRPAALPRKLVCTAYICDLTTPSFRLGSEVRFSECLVNEIACASRLSNRVPQQSVKSTQWSSVSATHMIVLLGLALPDGSFMLKLA